jgi:DNA-binding response OmpR family regulator
MPHVSSGIVAGGDRRLPYGGAESQRILVLDSDPAVADALAFLLKGYGYETVIARDVDNARDLLESESIDGVVTDPLFPGGGRHWLAELRAMHPDISVLVLTAESIDMLGLGTVYGLADAVLPKPSEPGVLVAVLRRTLGRWRGAS